VSLMIPPFAGLIALVVFGSGKHYSVRHVVFSLHFYAFSFIAMPATLSATLLLVRAAKLVHVQGLSDKTAVFGWSMALNAIIAVYLTIALRRAYLLSPARAVVGGIVAAFGSSLILMSYRAMVFFVTCYSV
jgi:hypothetical protein